MRTLKAILKSPVATIIFLIGGVSVNADKSSEWNVAASDFNHPNSSVRHDRERRLNIATSVVGGFNGAGRPSKILDGSLGMVALSRQDMRNSISRAQSSNIMNKRVSRSNTPYGYRSNGSRSNSNVPLALKGHVGTSISSSKRGQFRPSNRHPKIPIISSSSSRIMVPRHDRSDRLKLSSSIAANVPQNSSPLITALSQWLAYVQSRVSNFVQTSNKEDLALVVAYVCTQLAISE